MEKLSAATQNLKPERRHLTADLIAGLTFAVVNVPQAMAHVLVGRAIRHRSKEWAVDD